MPWFPLLQLFDVGSKEFKYLTATVQKMVVWLPTGPTVGEPPSVDYSKRAASSFLGDFHMHRISD